MPDSSYAAPSEKRPRFHGEWIFLFLLIVVLMVLNVPAQWTTIQTDPDFTAWGAATSNRIGNGVRLYEFGTHIPVAPLTYVFLYVVSSGHATWITESWWNQVAIMGTLLVMTAMILTAFKREVAFLAAIATLSLYTKDPTVLLYCSLTNFLAACLAWATVSYVRRSSAPTSRSWLVLMGLLASMVLLSKQSVGVLILPAAGVAVLALPKSAGLKSRVIHVAIYFVSAAMAFELICLFMSPVVNISGMINDVFVTGSECKGGVKEIIYKLIGFSCDIGSSLILAGIALAVAYGTGLFSLSPETGKARPTETKKRFPIWWLVAVSGSGLATTFVLLRLAIASLPEPNATLEIGLVVSVALAFSILFERQLKQHLPKEFLGEECALLGVSTIVLLPAAAGYCLSELMGSRNFLWWIGCVPLIQVSITAVVYFVFRAAARLPQITARITTTLFAVALIAMTWQPWHNHWLEIKSCTDIWEHVAWFRGARVTERARPLQSLVKEVRSLAKPNETVLFLPSDPNVEECFERPRPALNCPIVFSDFYWTRFVNADFELLKKAPPKVVIIGPKNNWEKINDLHNYSGAAKSLVKLVQTDLLPAHYHLVDTHQISYGTGVDYLDVWVRVD